MLLSLNVEIYSIFKSSINSIISIKKILIFINDFLFQIIRHY